MDNKYNGWTNYATWRVHLEIFDNYELEEELKIMEPYDLAFQLEEVVESLLLNQADENSLVYNYAMAFINDVNFQEIAEAVLEYNNDEN